MMVHHPTFRQPQHACFLPQDHGGSCPSGPQQRYMLRSRAVSSHSPSALPLLHGAEAFGCGNSWLRTLRRSKGAVLAPCPARRSAPLDAAACFRAYRAHQCPPHVRSGAWQEQCSRCSSLDVKVYALWRPQDRCPHHGQANTLPPQEMLHRGRQLSAGPTCLGCPCL